jgi:hypothetical protein
MPLVEADTPPRDRPKPQPTQTKITATSKTSDNAKPIAAGQKTAHRLRELQVQAVEQLREKLPEATVSETATVAKAGAIGAGISTDEASVLRGRPTQVHTTTNVAELVRSLYERWPQVFTYRPAILDHIDSTAKEPEDVEP